jgi:ribosome assembly protein RRB1
VLHDWLVAAYLDRHIVKMSKRSADASEDAAALKAGERPLADAPPDDMGEFEDEFEDEFESEDEILEAGVDGRPDAEREEEEKGMLPLRAP